MLPDLCLKVKNPLKITSAYLFLTQAWERYVHANKHGIVDKEEALNLMRALARAEYENEFIECAKRLEDSSLWKNNQQFRQYFTNQWWPAREVLNFFRDTVCLK